MSLDRFASSRLNFEFLNLYHLLLEIDVVVNYCEELGILKIYILSNLISAQGNTSKAIIP